MHMKNILLTLCTSLRVALRELIRQPLTIPCIKLKYYNSILLVLTVIYSTELKRVKLKFYADGLTEKR